MRTSSLVSLRCILWLAFVLTLACSGRAQNGPGSALSFSSATSFVTIPHHRRAQSLSHRRRGMVQDHAKLAGGKPALVTNSTAGAFSVEYTTNLVDWQLLGPATPRYLFTDTNAPAVPQRYYRLRWP